MGTFTNSEDPDEMQNNAQCCFSSGSTLFVKEKKSPEKRIKYFLKL